MLELPAVKVSRVRKIVFLKTFLLEEVVCIVVGIFLQLTYLWETSLKCILNSLVIES